MCHSFPKFFAKALAKALGQAKPMPYLVWQAMAMVIRGSTNKLEGVWIVLGQCSSGKVSVRAWGWQ